MAWNADRERVRRETRFGRAVRSDDLVRPGVVGGEYSDHSLCGGTLDVIREPAEMPAATHRDHGDAVLTGAVDRELDRRHACDLSERSPTVEHDGRPVVALDSRSTGWVDATGPAVVAVSAEKSDSVRTVPGEVGANE
jgi:hypothetical protein